MDLDTYKKPTKTARQQISSCLAIYELSAWRKLQAKYPQTRLKIGWQLQFQKSPCSRSMAWYETIMRSKAEPVAPKARPDGRKPLMLYLDPDVIRALKIEALGANTHAYLIVEQILKDHQRSAASNGSEQ